MYSLVPYGAAVTLATASTSRTTASEAFLLMKAKMPAGFCAHSVGAPPSWPKMSMPQILKSGFWVACSAVRLHHCEESWL